jgi:hypothetical protein
MRLHRPVVVFSIVALAAACGGAQAQPTTPRSRVAQDLGCTTERTSVQEIARIPGEAGARWQVRGCGRTAVYVCTLPVRDCWREGEIKPDVETTTTR